MNDSIIKKVDALVVVAMVVSVVVVAVVEMMAQVE